jgi:hypothetical protein
LGGSGQQRENSIRANVPGDVSEVDETAGNSMKLLLRKMLELKLTNGNDGRGNAFWKSAKFRKDCEQYLRMNALDREPFEVPVVVHVTRMFSGRERLWDSSSIGRGNWKEIEDALVAVGWFHDDCFKWIRRTVFDQRKHIESCVMVEVFEADEPT